MRNLAWLVCFVLLLGLPATAQEICGNCNDDDLDGVVECYDAECWGDFAICGDSFVAASPPPPECDITIELHDLWRATGLSDLAVPAAGDIDGDGFPELVYWSRTDLRILDGRDGSEERALTVPDGFAQIPAIGDVDGDGFGEIFIGSQTGASPFGWSLARYEHDLTETFSISSEGDPNYKYAGPSLADFNGDGVAEVFMIGYIFDTASGALLVDASPAINLTNTLHTLAADVLPDGACPDCEGLELIASHGVFAVNVTSGSYSLETPFTDTPRGTLALADWDGDQRLDVVVNQSGFLFSFTALELEVFDTATGTRIGPTHAFGGESASAPCVGDFDGDLELEVAVHTDDRALEPMVRIVDHDMTVLWDVPRPENSGWVSAVSFDFDCDGVPEIVQRGSAFVSIISGIDGTVLAEAPCTSGTNTERPLVLDVDADGDTDIVAGCSGGLNAWEVRGSPPGRQLDNQFNYFNVNINDDLSIPCPQQDHADDDVHRSLNGFLDQAALFTPDGRNCAQICFCGNGILDLGEACDDGNLDPSDECDGDCEPTICGDGILQTPNGAGSGGPAGDGFEECDDGNDVPDDGCHDCALVVMAVEFLEVSAVREPSGVRVSWSVGEELDTMGYVVRRGPSATEATVAVGWPVPATGPWSSYELFDPAPLAGPSWYVVEELCLAGGGCDLSPVVKVGAGASGERTRRRVSGRGL